MAVKKLKLFTFFIAFFISSLAWSQAQLRYEGYVEDSGSAVNASAQTFTVTIRKPGCATPAPGLTTYNSGATINIVNGEFNLTPTFDENQFAAAMDPATDWGGGGTCGPGSAREMLITWSGETFNVALQDAPRAIISKSAQTAQNLGSRNQDQFLKIDSFAAQTPLTNGQVNTLIQLVNGTATTFVKPGDTHSGDLSGTFAAPIVSGLRGTIVSATAPALNQVLKYNGTQWAPAADDAGAAPGDASYAAKGIVQFDTNLATSGINVTSGVASLPNTITAGGPTGNSNTVPVITYDAKGRLTTVSTATVNDNTKLPLAGGTMTGALDMGNQNITNVNSVSSTGVGTRTLTVYDADNSNFATLQVPAVLATNYALTLPVDDGIAGQVLSTDGNGVLSWIAPTSSSGDILNGGNSTGAVLNIGTNDNFAMNIETNGSPRIHLSSTGQVGINTNTFFAGNVLTVVPAGVIPVSPQVQSQMSLQGIVASGSNLGVTILEQNTSGQLFLGVRNNTGVGEGVFGTSTSDDLKIITNLIPRMTITSGGFVGINTTNPDRELHVNGPMRLTASALPGSPAAGDIFVDSGDGNKLKYYNGSAWVQAGGAATSPGGANGQIQFNNSSAFGGSANLFWDNSNSRLGIRTTAPALPVDIRGADSKVTNALVSYVSQVASADAVQPLALRSGIRTNATAANRYAAIDVDDNGTARALLLQPNGGAIGIGTGTTVPSFPLEVVGNTDIEGVLSVWGPGLVQAEQFQGASAGGSAGSPLYTYQGDPDTGLYFVDSAGNSSARISANGNDRISVSNSGVGINTLSPNTALDLNGGMTYRGIATGSAPATVAGQGKIYFDSTANKFKISENGGAYVDLIGGGSSQWTTGAGFIYYSGGMVGIGTVAPTRLLDVNGVMKLTPSGMPGVPSLGDLFIDSGDGNKLKYYNGTQWVNASAEGAGIASIQPTNTRIGQLAGQSLAATNTENSLFGNESGRDMLAGANSNSFFGSYSGRSVTLGSSNSLFGAGASDNLTTGSNNIIIGYNSGDQLTTQNNNLFIGINAGSAINDFSSNANVILGSNNGASLNGLSNHVLIADGSGNEKVSFDGSGYAKFFGPVKFGSTGLPCSAMLEGALRHVGGSNVEICNGLGTWGPVGGGGGFISPTSTTRVTPSYNFQGFASSGMYRDSSSGDIGLTINGNEKLRVLNTNGHVGIVGSAPTPIPEYMFHVNPGFAGSSTQVAQFEGSVEARLNEDNSGSKSPTLKITNMNGMAGATAIADFQIQNGGSVHKRARLVAGQSGTMGGNFDIDVFDNAGIAQNAISISSDQNVKINRTLAFEGMAADPVLSNANQAKIYFNNTSNQILVSKNTGVYEPLASGPFPSGTTAIPSITFQSDLDTGIYNPTINSIGFTTFGTEKMRIDSNGVGIGTMAPANDFEVFGDTFLSSLANAATLSLNGTNINMFTNQAGIPINISTNNSTSPVSIITNGNNSDVFIETNLPSSDISISTFDTTSKVILNGAGGSEVRNAKISPRVFQLNLGTGTNQVITITNNANFVKIVGNATAPTSISGINGCDGINYREGEIITLMIVSITASNSVTLIDSPATSGTVGALALAGNTANLLWGSSINVGSTIQLMCTRGGPGADKWIELSRTVQQ